MAEQEFLDYEGVEYLWGLVDSRLDIDEEFEINTRMRAVYGYDTVADMASDTGIVADAVSGAIAHTNGENVAGDGGAAWYKIDRVRPSVGETGAVALQNNNYAHRITNVLPRAEGGTGVGGIQETQVTIDDSVVATVANAPCRHNGVVCTVTVLDIVLRSALQPGESNDVVIGNVPAGWRPLGFVYAAIGFSTRGDDGIYFRIASNGDIRISNRSSSTLPAGERLTATATYVI